MAISNLNNQHLSNNQVEVIQKALGELETQLKVLNFNLTPSDRNKYGRVNEQNKLFINKVHDFAQAQPGLRSFDVDWKEFFRDYTSREFLEMLIVRLEALITRANNAKILHDYDNYQDALNDYSYTSFRAGAHAAGFEDKFNELKQFFDRKKHVTKDNTTDKQNLSDAEETLSK